MNTAAAQNSAVRKAKPRSRPFSVLAYWASTCVATFFSFYVALFIAGYAVNGFAGAIGGVAYFLPIFVVIFVLAVVCSPVVAFLFYPTVILTYKWRGTMLGPVQIPAPPIAGVFSSVNAAVLTPVFWLLDKNVAVRDLQEAAILLLGIGFVGGVIASSTFLLFTRSYV